MPEITAKERITKEALRILGENPYGLRYTELANKIKESFPDENDGNIAGNIWNLQDAFSDQVIKPSRGLFILRKFYNESRESEATQEQAQSATEATIEEDFYEPFRDWIIRDLEECSKAITLGGNRFGNKWGTPDVIGIKRSKQSDIIQSPIEVISAEIKTNKNDIIQAFGQACAYKLFSHRVYIVIPKDVVQADLDRIESLSLILGIGMVLFDNSNKDLPNFSPRVRAMKHEPDTYYINEAMKKVESELFG